MKEVLLYIDCELVVVSKGEPPPVNGRTPGYGELVVVAEGSWCSG